jgi:hypothetical protein
MAGSEDAVPGQPAISILLPTHNDVRFLPEAVQSILGQTHADLELVVVDDGSTDQTAAYLRSLADPRVRVIRLDTNRGITAALNAGLAECRGKYVARMDADDIAEPDRLRRQSEFLEANRDIGIVGSSRLLIDEQGKPIAPAPAMTDDLSIRWKCLLGNPLAHPTVMLRREIFVGYDLNYRAAQDYELWTRLLPLTRAANLAEPLLRYRIRPSSISRSRQAEQLANHDRIALLANRRLLPSFPLTAEQITQLRGRYGGQSVRDEAMDPADSEWIGLLEQMLSAFTRIYASHAGIDRCVRQQRERIRNLPRAAGYTAIPARLRQTPPRSRGGSTSDSGGRSRPE